MPTATTLITGSVDRLILSRPIPDGEVDVRKEGMEAIDGLHGDCLPAPRGKRHGIERDAASDPAGRVAGKDFIRQRRDDELGRSQGLDQQACRWPGKLPAGQAPDEVRGQHLGVEFCQVATNRLPKGRADRAIGNDAIQEPGAAVRVVEDGDEQICKLKHLDAAILHDAGEGIVFLTGTLNPWHFVEQHGRLVGRRQSPHF